MHFSYTVHLKKLGSVLFFFKEIKSFIYRGCIKLIKSDVYNYTKYFCFNAVLLNFFYSSVNPEKNKFP